MVQIRKLGKRNILLFVLFSVISIAISLIFGISILRVMARSKEIYELTSGSYVFDINTRFIQLSEKGTISRKWTGDYYLTSNNQEYDLGLRSVVYNENDYKVYLYGNSYQVLETGKIQSLSKQTEIVRIGVPSFYKLGDRKYLIVAKNIMDDKHEFKAENYLIIYLDKMGNAQLMNNKNYVKTINPMILETSDFKFDIANEKLIYGTDEIDLKSVIGSSNNYAPIIKNDKKEENNNNTTNNTINNNTSIGGIQYETSSSGNNQKLEIVKWFGIRSIVPGVTYIDIDYQVIDVLDEFTSVFVLVSDGVNPPIRVFLNKQNNNYRIKNLKPNYEYELSFGYNYNEKENGINTVYEKIDDVSKITTSKPNNSITITKVSSDMIYFNVKIDDNYKLESADINLYVDSVKINTLSIPISEAILKNGWSSKFPFNGNGHFVMLSVSNGVFNGEEVFLNVKQSYVNE